MPLSLGPNESAAYRNDLAPGPHLDLITAVGFRAVGAALRLGVFEALAAGPASARTLADRLGLDETGAGQLCALLVCVGYLTGDENGYANSQTTQRWLLRDAPGGYAPVAALWQDLLFGLWDNLEASLRKGSPATDFYPWLARHPQARAEFDAMLTGQAHALSAEILDLVPLPPTATRLLDIGGGHAVYSTAFCRAHPRLSATVVDLPTALAAGRRTVTEAALTDRIRLLPGDWSDLSTVDSAYDVALLFNVLHGNRPEQNIALLTRIAAALRPGGIAVILDHLPGMAPPEARADFASLEAFVHAFSLNLFHTQGGRIHPRADIDTWLTTAHLTTGEWTPLRSLPSLHLTVARRD